MKSCLKSRLVVALVSRNGEHRFIPIRVRAGYSTRESTCVRAAPPAIRSGRIYALIEARLIRAIRA